ncbi:MAG: hypothetical protein ACYTEQ_30455 [Planctomycetota bacterium]|jgi:hypothetical protein
MIDYYQKTADPTDAAFNEAARFFEGKVADRPYRESPLTAVQGEKGAARIPGEQGRSYDLREKVTKRDVLPASEYIMSPEMLFKSGNINPKNWKPAEKIAARLIETTQEHHYASAQDKIRFDEIIRPLKRAEQIQMTKLNRKQIAPEDVSPKVRKAGAEAMQQTAEIREDVKDYKRDMYKRYLSAEENNALARAIAGGEDLRIIAEEGGLDYPVLEEIYKEYKSIDKWGIDDYVTNFERGTYRVVDESGTTVAVGVKKKDAARKADAYAKSHPETKTLWIDNSFGGGSTEFPTLLSRGNYLKMVNRLGAEYAEDIKTIQKILHERGSVVAVEPTNKWTGPMQKRYNILEGEENIADVMPAYFYVMRKKMALDPVLADARQEVWKLPKNEQAAMMRLLEEAKGKKTVMDRTADAILERFGVGAKPFAYSRATRHAGTATAWMKLGYRPVAGVVNLASGQAHTWVKVGNKYMGDAAKFLRTKEGKAFVQEEAPHLGITFAQDSRICIIRSACSRRRSQSTAE